MRIILLGFVALFVVGCGQSEKVTIGNPGEKGVYQREIDKSKDTATEASAKVKDGDKEAFGI